MYTQGTYYSFFLYMKLTFFGAAHQVTGSCYLLETKEKKILVDCGMFQGSNYNEGKNHDAFGFDPKEIDAVLLTHAHLDHTGRIPKLVKDGFTGPVYATKGSCEISHFIWMDAFHIMQYNNKKYETPILYDQQDIDRATAQCHGVDYKQRVDLGGGVSAVFRDAGHIFGSSFIEVTADGKTIGFSGDIGNNNVPILRETSQLGAVDVLLCESTYGDRIHETRAETKKIIFDLIHEGYKRGGTIMVPTFSIERTQEFLYDLHNMEENGFELPDMPIYLDSPLAIDVLPTYKKYPEYYDREATCLHNGGNDFFQFPRLQITRSREESIAINSVKGPKMVIAGAGMMNGGRIVHHAYRYLSDPNSTLIIVGYQADGTLGRKLYEGSEKVKIFGDEIDVRCMIKAVGGLSAHGDKTKLLSWVRNAQKIPEKIYCVHGESHSATALAHLFRDELAVKTVVPEEGDVAEI